MAENDCITVLIVDDIPDTHESLKKLLYFEKDIKVVGAATSGPQAIELAKRLSPDVILMDINMPGMDGIATTEALVAQGIASQVIMMSIQGETDYLRRSMLAGAREFLIKPFTGEELANSIRRVQRLRPERIVRQVAAPVGYNGHDRGGQNPPERGQIIAVFGPKGGVGRTTIVSNLAVALKERTQRKVALVDCSLQFGDVAVLFNLHPTKTIVDLVPHVEKLDDDIMDDVMATHSSGVRLLLAPPRPEMAELVTAEMMTRVLVKLRESYDYVLVDTWPSFHDQMLAVLDVADRILVIITLELPALKNAKLFLEIAESLGYPATKLIIVLNRADSSGGIKVSDVEATLGRPIAVSVVSDGRLVTQALNQGIPFVTLNRQSNVARCVFALAERIAEIDGRALQAKVGQPRLSLPRLASLPFKRN